MPRPVTGLLLAVLLALLPAPAAFAADVAPPQDLDAGTALAPGNSGFFSIAGQLQGMVTKDPAAYGPNVDDQRRMFWGGDLKDGRFKPPAGTPQTPRPGVRVYTDDKGVPVVYGDSAFDVWFGAGWAAGQQRLFLADAVRRMGRGTFAELVGPSGVPADVQARTLTYSQAEYDAMFAALPAESQQAITGYAAGLDAWITHVRVTPADLPAEYALLSTLPAPWTVTDTLAAGVLITRTVAASGGTELLDVDLLRTLQSTFGAQGGLGAFSDLRWQQDEKATVTVPPSSGRFDANAVVPAAQRDAVFRSSAQYALGLPQTLGAGPGTGAYPQPQPPFTPAPVTATSQVPDTAAAAAAALPPAVRDGVRGAVAALNAYRSALRGGSYAFAVSGSRTTTGKPMLVSGPQLGYSYPNLLWEIEVHGAGFDARGATVPALPTVGIGYGRRVAWALTTGYSKTIDSFIETVRRDPQGNLQYLHNGSWKAADCRTETVRYRGAAGGVPAGPAVFAVTAPVCRTVHGPVVAYDEKAGLARSVQYAMYRRELETVNGILAWNKAQDFAQFEAGVRQVTWNENVMYADADGRIAYWHPGLYLRRSPAWDARFPAPGTGEYDAQGYVPFDAMPHAVDPPVGYLANWNNKPAAGWVDEYLEPAASRPAGTGNRVKVIQTLLAQQPRMSPADLRATEFRVGGTDQRALDFLPKLQRLTSSDPQVQAAVDLLRQWDGVAYDPASFPTPQSYTDATVTDSPAVTVFARFMNALRDNLFADLPAAVRMASDDVGSHVWDVSVIDNLALRVLDPASSSLGPSRDWARGRSTDQVLTAALGAAVAALVRDRGSDPAAWRDPHPRRPVNSLTGVIGPSLTMPYQDRGSWLQVVAFRPAGPPQPEAAAVPPAVRPAPAATLAATGPGSPPVALAGLVLVATAAILHRARRRARQAHSRVGTGRATVRRAARLTSAAGS